MEKKDARDKLLSCSLHRWSAISRAVFRLTRSLPVSIHSMALPRKSLTSGGAALAKCSCSNGLGCARPRCEAAVSEQAKICRGGTRHNSPSARVQRFRVAAPLLCWILTSMCFSTVVRPRRRSVVHCAAKVRYPAACATLRPTRALRNRRGSGSSTTLRAQMSG